MKAPKTQYAIWTPPEDDNDDGFYAMYDHLIDAVQAAGGKDIFEATFVNRGAFEIQTSVVSVKLKGSAKAKR